MALSTNLISGLSSGFDWRSMIDQLIGIDNSRVELIEDRKTEYETKLAEWQNVNSMLLALKTASGALSTESAFNVFKSSTTSDTSTAASDILTVSTTSSTSPALYNIAVNNLAQSEKISSTNYEDTDTALGLKGDIIVSGKVVNIVITDTLADIKDNINSVNTGSDPSNVTASIISHSSTNFHLILTSDATGEDGLSVLEGAYSSGDDILETMGFISGTTAAKTATSDGAKSDLFDSSNGAIKTLLGLTNAPAATTVQIGGLDVSIDLSSATETLTTIAQKIDALAGISAAVVSETVDGETKYRIDISGTTSFTESAGGNGNVLQTLGILEGTYGTEAEVHSGSAIYAIGGAAVVAGTTFDSIFTGALRGDVSNTELDQVTAISSTTTWNQIDTTGVPGNDIDDGDRIYVSGKQHDGTVVSETYTITAADTLDGFLTQVKTWFGGSSYVDAYFDDSGRLIVEDLQSGSSQMTVTVEPESTETSLTFNTVSTDPFGNNITNGDKISISGTQGDGATVSAFDYTITDKSANTIQNFLDQINNTTNGFQKTGTQIATASVSSGQIIITDGTAGDSQLSLSLIADNSGGGTLDFGAISMTTEGRNMQVAAGEDAEIVVDNVTISNSSNTITDVIAGATLNLVGEDSSTTVTLKVERDLASIKSKIEDMVSAYNTIMEYINTQSTYDEDTEEVGGILFGDGTLSTIKSELISTVTKTVTGASSDYNKLALIGITLDVVATDEGEYNRLNLVIDDDGVDGNDLMDYLETNLDDVKKLFIASGTSPYSNLTYVGHTDDTEGGAYKVTISQAATQTTFTGQTDVGGGLLANDTLSITDFETDRLSTVSLTSGDSIDDVVNTLNSEFAEKYTEVLQGDQDTGYTTSTTFSTIDAGSDDAVITFSGKRRNGLNVSGSYTISDSTTETLSDLLEGIEDMFEDEVTATLDSNGKLIITDTQAGDSLLEFTMDTSAVAGLNFGTVSTTTEGRYAMTITASKTAEDKLLLTHNTYGTGHGIVVSHTNTGDDPLGLNGVSQVWGVDVDGTINALDATGSGQRLTLDSDGNNADGLSISYTGTSTIAEGDNINFTLTLGIGELLDRRLGFITNSSDGYVTYKQTSLGNSIDSFETQIENMQASLNRKMESMINRFVAMELALANIQNQSQWLAGQISASLSGWV